MNIKGDGEDSDDFGRGAAMSEGIWLFSYGTLRQLEVQERIFGRRLEGYDDKLLAFAVSSVKIDDDFALEVSGREEHPILRPGQAADEVNGIAFLLTKDDLDKADAYETCDYRRIAVTLVSGRKAFVYVDAQAA